MSSVKERSPKLFLLIALATACSFLIINLTLMAFTVGIPTSSSERLCSPIQKRLEEANHSPSPKVVLIGGSGVRAGFSAEYLSQELNANVFNFGLQAALGLDVILFESKKILKPGDTAVLAFEYNQFNDSKWNSIRLSYVLGCATDWFENLSLSDKFSALLAVETKRLLDIFLYGLEKENMVQVDDSGPLNKFGDRDITSFPKLNEEDKFRLSLYQPMQFKFDDESSQAATFKDFLKYAQQKDIKVIVTWPNTIDHDEYHKLDTFAPLEKFFASLDVIVVGKPELGMYPVEAFYDTQYHLNYDAIKVRTKDFSDELHRKGIKIKNN